jgi:hypothetical protein
MPPQLLEAILDKALRECDPTYVGLFNWTEPLLHPQISEMVRAVRTRGLSCGLSSNLNVSCDFRNLLSADPTTIRVSLSGFQQDTYGVTHRRGNIELVKANMHLLADAKRATGSQVDLQVLFHRYLGNHDDEEQMRTFAEDLGYRFQPVWAYLMPLEKTLAYLGVEETGTRITAEDRALINRLALPPDEASRAVRHHVRQPCVLQTERLAIDWEGNVQLCCTVFDRKRYSVANYLAVPLEEIQRRRLQHALCQTCTRFGLHVIAVYGATELEDVAMANVVRAYPGVKLERTISLPIATPNSQRPNNWALRLLSKLYHWPARRREKRRRPRQTPRSA